METRYNTHKIGDRIKYLREKAGLNQTELANFLNVKPSAISNIENNKNSISLDLLVKVCKFFNVSSDFILSLDDYKLKTTSEIIDININEKNYVYIENLEKDELDSIKNIIDIIDKLKKSINSSLTDNNLL